MNIKEELESLHKASVEEMLGGKKHVEMFNEMFSGTYIRALNEAYFNGFDRGCNFMTESLRELKE